jgi:hypothetical protein
MIPPQLQGERPNAYAAFSEYCRLGSERSVRKVGRVQGKARATVEVWSVKYRWQERVAEYDANVSRTAHEAEEQALKDEAAYFAKEIIAHRRQALEDSAALRKVALAKLQKLSKATLGDICRALQAADGMKRLALNMATEKTEVSGPDNAPLAIQSAAPVVIVLPDNGRDTPKG